MDKYNIVLAPDNKYVEHACATIASILHNTNYLDKISINIIDQELTADNKGYISDLVKKYGVDLFFKQINKKVLNNVVVSGHISEASYYRVLSPSIFEGDIQQYLYLDCDIIVREDITKLFSFNINDKIIGAIRNYDFKEQLNNINLPIDAPYFNAGVLLINKKLFDQFDITNKIIKFINDNPEKLIHHDQDALNAILYKAWYELPLRWNLRTQTFNYYNNYELAGVKKEVEYNELVRNPAIVHFTTWFKPWHYFNRHPFKQEYEYYLNLSGYPRKKKSIEHIISKAVYIFGASKRGDFTYDILNEREIKVKGFLDNDEKKWGKQLKKFPIFSPKNIIQNLDNEIIVIASQYEDEIVEQLINFGLTEDIHFYVMEKYLSI